MTMSKMIGLVLIGGYYAAVTAFLGFIYYNDYWSTQRGITDDWISPRSLETPSFSFVDSEELGE